MAHPKRGICFPMIKPLYEELKVQSYSQPWRHTMKKVDPKKCHSRAMDPIAPSVGLRSSHITAIKQNKCALNDVM
jgi:hypothetical protein